MPFDGPHGKRELGGAVFFGMFLGLLLCAIPLLVLLRKVRRLKKMGRRGDFHGGRWKFKGQGPHHGHGPHRGFPEYEPEHLVKPEYEALLDY
ncbi:hypothetical protein DFH09DRAFT_1341386 [Mycena vulgaris]|nr:hypothetical protein DFH09DRAFT_1341386 [Mycena vulgaris]